MLFLGGGIYKVVVRELKNRYNTPRQSIERSHAKQTRFL